MRWAAPLLFGLALCDGGCGTSGDSGRVDARADGPSAEDAPSDGAGCREGASCDPYGTWDLTYGSTSCGPMGGDTLVVDFGPDGGVAAGLVGREPPPSTCGPQPMPGTYLTSATLSANGCTLTLSAHASWCTSGEDQCDDRDLVLSFCGPRGSGTLQYRRCWCGSGPSGTLVQVNADATRR